jgi:hypothetical protein
VENSASGASGSSRAKGGRWGPMCTRTLPAGELHARREAEQRRFPPAIPGCNPVLATFSDECMGGVAVKAS